MAKDDTKHYSRADIAAMKTRSEVRATPADAPEVKLDEAFWDRARIVGTRPRRKASVHLRLDPDTLEFYRSAGRGHLTRMAEILKAYADTQTHAKHRQAADETRATRAMLDAFASDRATLFEVTWTTRAGVKDGFRHGVKLAA